MTAETENALPEILLREAASRPAEASPEFMARMLDDALRLQPVRPAPARMRPGFTRRVALWIAGWLAGLGAVSAGLSAAAAAGVLIGMAQPASLISVGETLDAALGGSPAAQAEVEQLDLMPSLEGWLSEI